MTTGMSAGALGRRVRCGTQPAAQTQPIFSGQHQVQHDQIDLGLRKRGPHRLAVGDRSRPVAVLAQIRAEQIADLGVVVDDQNVVRDVVRDVIRGVHVRFYSRERSFWAMDL